MYRDTSWDVVNNRHGGRLLSADDAQQTLTGRAPTWHDIADVGWENVRDWLASGVMLDASTPDTVPPGPSLVTSHCYAITDAYTEAFSGRHMMTVYNRGAVTSRSRERT